MSESRTVVVYFPMEFEVEGKLTRSVREALAESYVLSLADKDGEEVIEKLKIVKPKKGKR